jgi:hypothetical protein
MYNSGARHNKQVDGDKAGDCYPNLVDDNRDHYDKEALGPEVLV